VKGTPIVAAWVKVRVLGFGVTAVVGTDMYWACAPSEVKERVFPEVL